MGGLAFTLVATANAAGYRYGVSDQAFYIPVIIRALDPSAFPRDASLIDAQGRLMLADEAFASLVARTGIPLESLFLIGYLLSIALIWTALILIGERLYRHRLATLALCAAFTLRHRIARTSANTFEPYFHPRMLAFGICLLAVAAFLRRRHWLAVALVGAGALVHVTTALWFAVLLGVALLIVDPPMRRLALTVGSVAAAAAIVALGTGAVHGPLTRMDAVWLEAVASKDSLFATQWPAWTWFINLGLLGLLWIAENRRRQRGAATPATTALVWGATALVALFLVTLPLVAWRLAFPVQLQISRVFWLVDLLATAWVIGELADASSARARLALIVIALVAGGRGTYIMTVEQPERSLFAVHLAATPWQDAMAWLRNTPRAAHVLADPGHAWKYGTSVRVSAERDVFLEEQKDSAIAMYSRDVAVRVVERQRAIGDAGALTAGRADTLARRYGLDYLVTEMTLPLSECYRNRQFHIYALSTCAR